jgi:hypothetical protein
MYFVSKYENRRMESVEIVLRKEEGRRENDGGGKSKIYCKQYVNITMYPPYNYYMLIKI